MRLVFSVFDNGNSCIPRQLSNYAIYWQILATVLTTILCDIHGICFRVSAYGSLKTKEKSKSNALEVPRPLTGISAYQTEFVWEFETLWRRSCVELSAYRGWICTRIAMFNLPDFSAAIILFADVKYRDILVWVRHYLSWRIQCSVLYLNAYCQSDSVTAWYKSIVYRMWPSNLWSIDWLWRLE